MPAAIPHLRLSSRPAGEPAGFASRHVHWGGYLTQRDAAQTAGRLLSGSCGLRVPLRAGEAEGHTLGAVLDESTHAALAN